MIGLLMHSIQSLRVIRHDGTKGIYKIPKKAFLTESSVIGIPALATEWTFKKDGKSKKYPFGEDKMIMTLETGDYEVDLEFKDSMTPFYVVYDGTSECLVRLFDDDKGSLDADDIKDSLSSGFYIGNVANKELNFKIEPENAKLNVQLFTEDGNKSGKASDMTEFTLKKNTLAFVKRSTEDGVNVTKIQSDGYGKPISVRYDPSNTDAFYTMPEPEHGHEHGERTKIEVVFDENPKPENPDGNPGEKPGEKPEKPEKPEDKEERVEYSVESTDKKYVCTIGSKGTMTVRFTKPHGCFIPEIGYSFASIAVEFFDGSKEIEKRTYEYDREKPLRFIDGGRYEMTITVSAGEGGFLAVAHSIPVSLRAIGLVSENNLELEGGQTSEVYLKSSHGTNYTWEAKDAVLTEIGYANLRNAPQSLAAAGEGTAREVHFLVRAAEGSVSGSGKAKGSVRFKNEGQKTGDFVWYTTNDTPKLQIFGDLLADLKIGTKSSVGMIVGIVVGVIVIVGVVGTVVGLYVTKKACFATKVE